MIDALPVSHLSVRAPKYKCDTGKRTHLCLLLLRDRLRSRLRTRRGTSRLQKYHNSSISATAPGLCNWTIFPINVTATFPLISHL